MESNKITKMDENEVTWLKNLKNKSTVFTNPYSEIHILQKYFDHGIAENVGQFVELFGIFEILLWSTYDIEDEKPEKVFFMFKSKITTAPSYIREDRNIDGDKEIVLCYNEGATFVTSTDVRVDSNVASKMLDIVTLGYLPNIMPYEEISRYWTDVNTFNGMSLDSMSQSAIDIITSALCRDPKDISRPFRHRLRDNPNFDSRNWKMINIRLLPKYTSAFASLTSGNPRGNLVSVIGRNRQGKSQKESPLEDAIL